MSQTSLNAKYRAKDFSFFQSILAHDLWYCDTFSPQASLMKKNTLKLVQMNHRRMAFCI